MFRKSVNTLETATERLIAQIESGEELTVEGVQDACQALIEAGQRAGAVRQNEAIRRLRDYVPDTHPVLAGLVATTCGALVEAGADPELALEPISFRLSEILVEAAKFAEACRALAPEEADAEEDEEETEEEEEDYIEKYGSEVAPRMQDQADAYSALDLFCMPVVAMLSRSVTARQETQANRTLANRVARFPAENDSLHFLQIMLNVLDDEELLILHVEEKRGYRVQIRGISDNFQLHGLLAQTLIGDTRIGWLSGKRPRAGEGVFDMVNWPGWDGSGPEAMGMDAMQNWIWGEGIPADILPFEGTRVVLLKEQTYKRSWNPDRMFSGMQPQLHVLETLTPDAVQDWLDRFAQAPRV